MQRCDARRARIVTWSSVAGLAVLAVLNAGCGAKRYVYTVDPMPVVVTPPASDWGVGLQVSFDDQIRIRVANESTEPVRVLWGESGYIDIDNRTHPVLTPAARRAKLAASEQPPALVAPGATLEERLTPLRHSLDSGADPYLPPSRASWVLSPAYVGDPLFTPQAVREHGLIGKQIGLLLVLDRNGERKNVLAKYSIGQVRVSRR